MTEKKTWEDRLIVILEKLARREVGVDIDIAEFKAEFYTDVFPQSGMLSKSSDPKKRDDDTKPAK